jgi:hypothetical protein
MEDNWAVQHLQVIRTLMERSALYRRALAPVMTFAGAVGIAAAVGGGLAGVETARGFVGFWMGVGLVVAVGAFLLVRRQALKAAEPFWSPPTRRVAQAALPPFLIGLAAGALSLGGGRWDFVQPWALPGFWMLLYGCGLHAAGFFMARGIKLLGWLFVLAGCAVMTARWLDPNPWPLLHGHKIMGAAFGGLHLAYGIYLYFTEKGRDAA